MSVSFSTILAELRSDRPYNFHSHTQFCDGRATMADFAAEAARRGFSHYGFSPHSPAPITTGCNMALADVPAYLAESRRLKTLYDGQVKLLCGMEIDYFGSDFGPASSLFQNMDLDYRIGSVHFVPSYDGTPIDIDGSAESFKAKMSQYFDNDLEYVVRTFYDHTIAMIEAGGFDILGHFDKIGHNADHFRADVENEPWYRTLLNRTIDAIVATNPVVEINTKAYASHRCRLFPSADTVRRLRSAGIRMVVSTDAHWPELMEASREAAMKLL